jgi:hypothetical protein
MPVVDTRTLGGIQVPQFRDDLSDRERPGGLFERINFAVTLAGDSRDYRITREAVAQMYGYSELRPVDREKPYNSQVRNDGSIAYVWDNPGIENPLPGALQSLRAGEEAAANFFFKLQAQDRQKNENNLSTAYVKWVITFKRNADGTWTITGRQYTLSAAEYEAERKKAEK